MTCPSEAKKLKPVILFAGVFLLICFVWPTFAVASHIPIKRWTTKNGITLLLMESHSLPTVHVETLVKAGSMYDPEDKAGLANLTAALLDEGTTSRSSVQIAEEIDFIGAVLSASADSDYTSISLKVLKKDVRVGFSLLSDILTHPTFPAKEVERLRQQVLGGIMADRDEPEIVAEKAFDRLLFGAHPYHRPVEGLEETIPQIQRDDLVNFHNTYYRPNNTLMAIVGDLTKEEAENLIKEYLRGWEKKKLPAIEIPKAFNPTVRKVEIIDKDLTQANILLGQLGIARRNPDYYALLVMNYILGGGGFSSRLLTVIRENQGLAYSVQSAYEARYDPGRFTVSLQTKNSTANTAIQEVLNQLRQIRTVPVSDQELEEARSYLAGSFPLRMDTNAKMARLLSFVEFFKLGLDYFDQYPRYIQAVTKADVLRVAQKYLNPDRLILVAVAKQPEAKIELSH
jgi:zinc protease